jgi:hypothetical protein
MEACSTTKLLRAELVHIAPIDEGSFPCASTESYRRRILRSESSSHRIGGELVAAATHCASPETAMASVLMPRLVVIAEVSGGTVEAAQASGAKTTPIAH